MSKIKVVSKRKKIENVQFLKKNFAMLLYNHCRSIMIKTEI